MPGPPGPLPHIWTTNLAVFPPTHRAACAQCAIPLRPYTEIHPVFSRPHSLCVIGTPLGIGDRGGGGEVSRQMSACSSRRGLLRVRWASVAAAALPASRSHASIHRYGNSHPPRPARQGPDESATATERSPEHGHKGPAPYSLGEPRKHQHFIRMENAAALLDHPKLHFDAQRPASRTQSRAFVTGVPLSTELTVTPHRAIARCPEPPKLAPGTTRTATASAGLLQSKFGLDLADADAPQIQHRPRCPE